MKKILLVFLSICLLTGAFTGCRIEDSPYVPTGNGLSQEGADVTPTQTQDDDAPETELVLVYYPDASMNPYESTDFTNRTLFSLLYQGLFSTDRDYNSWPILCDRYRTSEDMRTYTFYIANATFSDGTPVTINDVYASYLAARESKFYSGRFQHVSDITLSDDGGITFSLRNAYENFPILLDIPVVKSTEVASASPLGSGPYRLEQTTGGMRLVRRENWWCTSDLPVNPSAIPLSVATSVTGIRDAFEFSDVGLVCANPGSDTYVDFRCDYELWDCENGIFMYLGCNMDSKVFSKQAVRAALTYAIDRDSIVDKYYRSFAHSASLPASPLSPYYSTSLAAKYSYDQEKFKQALADNGAAGKTVRLLVNKRDTMRLRIARTIGEMLTECGLVVEMVELTGDDYLYTLNIRNYDLYLGQTKLSPNMDLSPFFRSYGNLRYGGMTDAACYALCLEALANKGNYYNLHSAVMEDGRLCPVLFQSYSVHATRGLLTGLTPSRDNVFFYTVGRTMADALIPLE